MIWKEMPLWLSLLENAAIYVRDIDALAIKIRIILPDRDEQGSCELGLCNAPECTCDKYNYL